MFHSQASVRQLLCVIHLQKLLLLSAYRAVQALLLPHDYV